MFIYFVLELVRDEINQLRLQHQALQVKENFFY